MPKVIAERSYSIWTDKPPTIARVRAIVQRGNPDAKGLTVRWVSNPRRVTYPRGGTGFIGRISVDAEGYKPRTMMVDSSIDGTRIA